MRRWTVDRSAADRRGVVLILALGLLVLFTIVAITLATISKTAATSAANYKRLEQFGSLRLDVAPEEVSELFRFAMNQLIYDTRNKQSAIRGHSLLRDMYGSPDRYSLNTAGVTLADVGAEFRLKSVDALRLAQLQGNTNDPLRTQYQGVYNGTGIFLPRKIGFANLISGTPTVDDLGLSDEEIAVQTAYLHAPPSMGSFAMTKAPFGVTAPPAWAAFFLPVFGAYPTTPPDVRLWYPRYPLNYTVFDAFTAKPTGTADFLNMRMATPTYPGGREIEPELFYASNVGAGDPSAFHWWAFDEDYDYPDINNLFLASEQADGRILIPSFHRPQLATQVTRGLAKILGVGGVNPMTDVIPLQNGGQILVEQVPYAPEWALPPQARGQNLRGLTLRPRPADYDPAHMGIANPRAGTFPSLPSPAPEITNMPRPGETPNSVQFDLRLPDDIDGSGFIGDSPSELDVDTDGDGLKDAIWVDLGHPVISVGDVSFKPMFAFKVLDLDGKLNLNVHGNVYRTPNADPDQAVSYPLQHSSNYGATAAEVNLGYVFCLGDVPLTGNVPPRPTWTSEDTGASTQVTQADETNPLKRILFGDARTNPPAPGRWTPSSESTVTARGSAPGQFGVDDNKNADFLYSEGNGDVVATMPPASRFPAVQGRYSQADFRGVGKRFEAFSDSASQNAGAFGLVPGEGNVVPGLLNHASSRNQILSTGPFGAHIANLANGSSAAGVSTPTSGGLDPTLLTMDEPAESNIYDASSTDNSFFTAAEMAALLSAGDIDGSQVNNRLALLSPAQLYTGLPDAADAQKGYYTAEQFAKKRMRRMLTHSSWDLIRFNAPPMSNPYNLLAPALASDKFAFLTPLSVADPGNPYAAFGRKHSGTIGVDRIFAQLVGNVQPGQLPQEYQQVFTQFQTAIADLSTKLTADGLDTLLPREVLEGRRFDLNRPLSSYVSAQTGLAVGPAIAAQIDLEREAFAQQIYVLLYLACGPMTAPTNTGVDALISKELRCAQGRVLAQIAVNIVDYIDPDSVMTRMQFDPDLSDGWEPNDSSGINPPPTTQEQWTSVNTVFGFELPELVINEGVSVCVEEIQDPDPNQPGDEVRVEKRFVWAELFNPWPGYIDAVDNQPGVLLCKQNGESIYKIGVRDQHQSWVDSDPSLPALNQFVTFNVADPNDTDGVPPVINPPRVLSRDPSGADKTQGYFVIGPADPESKILRTDTDADDLLPPDVWLPPTGGAGGNNGDNDYTATNFYREEIVPSASFKPIGVELKLYRLRNPYRQFDREQNPYVVLDFLRMQGNRRALSHWYLQGSAQNWQEVTTNTEVEAGAYYVPDPSSTDPPPDAPPLVTNTERYSLQRRQPWHGYNSEWTPYGRTTAHPLYRDYLAQGESYLEGLFLGLPSLADNGQVGANDPLRKYGDVDHMENGMVQNGFVPSSIVGVGASGGAPQIATLSRNGNGRPNVDVAHTHYLTFPFANRQLHSPLELLSVRMYGSHMWFVGNEAGANGPQPTGGTIPEWRLRFTDDFEFAVRPWVPSWGTSSLPQDQPMYERVWRSRQVPWFLDSRLTHPNWPQLTPVDLLNSVSDWNSLGNKIGSHVGPQFMVPFPHLFRFFEFVECHNRTFDGDALGDANKWDFNSGGGNVTRTNRKDRVPGKVNLNTWVDEEVLQGVIDSVSAMYANPVETATAVQNFLTSGTVQASFPLSELYWPVGYSDALTSPLGEAPLGAARDYASRLVGWGDLGLASNDAVTVGNGAILPFGGMDLYIALLWQVTNPVDLLSLNNAALNQAFSPNRQFPGIVKGPLDPQIGTAYPGTDPAHLFSSEMARTALMSRNGPDGIMGTGDDKPFRSYAAESVSDTILRQRNFLTTDFVHSGEISLVTLNDALTGGGNPQTLITEPGIAQFLASTYADGADDVYQLPNPLPTIGVGDYIVRLGGQWTPRLFDPIPDPYSDELRTMLFAVGANANLGEQTRPVTEATDPDTPVDYWMVESRRNEVLVKMANNTTTRSHVFAVWVTVGLFRVEPGTEHLKVPLLGSEVGSEIGRPVRHRAFFIVDRSKAEKYDYEDIDANYELPQIDLIEYYKVVE